MQRVKIRFVNDDLVLSGSVSNESFSPEDSIFFSNVLPGEQKDNGEFYFTRKTLGRPGISDLFAYLKEKGFELDLDTEGKRAWAGIQGKREELSESIDAGARLKKKPTKALAIPKFRRELKPFQIPSTAHMIAVAHAANFSVPGSGKTTIALATFAHHKSKKALDLLVIIGPRSSFAPWEGEAKACLSKNAKFVRISGTKEERSLAWDSAQEADVVILNYHTAVNDVECLAYLLESRPTMLVADESHYIKSISDGKWTTTLRSIAPLARKRVILSGTPAPNSVADLWSQFTFLYPDESLLGTRSEFLYRVNKSHDPTGDLREKIYPLFWRIKKRDLRLPKPKVKKIYVKFGPIQAAIYDALAAKLLHDSTATSTETAKLKMWRRARLIRMLQAASNPALLAHYSEEFKLPPLGASGLPISDLILRYSDYEVPNKIQSVVALIQKLVKQNRKVILWTSFVHNIKMLLRLLKDIGPLPLYGGIALTEKEDAEINRERIINAFRTSSSVKLLIANPAACAESISLQKICQDAIYLDRTFNCAHFLQSKDRIHRIGLDKSDLITYYYYIGEDSIDEVVDSRLGEKERRMRLLLEEDLGSVNLDSGEDVVSESSEEEIDFAETLKQIKTHFGNGS